MSRRYDLLATEQPNPNSVDIDCKTTREILQIISNEDRAVADAVATEIDNIAKVVELVVQCLVKGGRLFYVGAGTSGRLGVLDAAECPPTFGTNPDQIQGIMAGGMGALVHAAEGAEDYAEDGARDVKQRRVGNKDIVIGISTSGVTAFVGGALRKAAALGANTALLTCNTREVMDVPVNVVICPMVGPEVVTGSTRMKAGTATKLVLNMISTAAMIRLGKVYGNLMVDLTPTCHKLKERYRRIFRRLTGTTDPEADAWMEQARYRLKTALAMKLKGLSRSEAEKKLEKAGGFLRRVLDDSMAFDG